MRGAAFPKQGSHPWAAVSERSPGLLEGSTPGSECGCGCEPTRARASPGMGDQRLGSPISVCGSWDWVLLGWGRMVPGQDAPGRPPTAKLQPGGSRESRGIPEQELPRPFPAWRWTTPCPRWALGPSTQAPRAPSLQAQGRACLQEQLLLQLAC